MGGIKVGGVEKRHFVELSEFLILVRSFMFFAILERFGGVRQCWEQERTTCSGGYPSATCSAFLRTTVIAVFQCLITLLGGICNNKCL